MSPPIYKYLFLSHSSPILSKIVFPLNTDLLKAPENEVISQDSLLPKNVSAGLTVYIIFLSSEKSSNFCTLIHPIF